MRFTTRSRCCFASRFSRSLTVCLVVRRVAGGTTDIAAIMGDQGRALLKERGRWASDTAYVYARALASSHLTASARVGDADGRELEAMLAGWAQPSTFGR